VTPGCTTVLLLPVDVTATPRPATTLLFTSRTVTVIVEVTTPSATTPVVGAAVAVDSDALTWSGSPTKPTDGCSATTTWLCPGLIVAVMVLVSARMLAIVPVATPPASVTPGCTTVLLLPVDATATPRPATVLLLTSRTVTVIVEVTTPSATTPVVGAAVAVDSDALTWSGSPTKPTDGCSATTTWLCPGLIVAVMVLVSARMLAIVPIATPPASVTPGCTNVLLLPVDASATLWPATVLPFWSRTVTVIVAVATPSATTPVSGEAVAVDRAALRFSGSPTKTT